MVRGAGHAALPEGRAVKGMLLNWQAPARLPAPSKTLHSRLPHSFHSPLGSCRPPPHHAGLQRCLQGGRLVDRAIQDVVKGQGGDGGPTRGAPKLTQDEEVGRLAVR